MRKTKASPEQYLHITHLAGVKSPTAVRNTGGTFFTLLDRLTTAQKKELQARHGNIKFLISQSQYAPEQKN